MNVRHDVRASSASSCSVVVAPRPDNAASNATKSFESKPAKAPSPGKRANGTAASQQAAGLDTTLDQAHQALAQRDARDAARGEAAPQIHPGDQVLQNDNLSVEEAIRRLLAWTQATYGSDCAAS